MSVAANEIPAPEHPWARRYAEQGRERPQMIEFKRPAAVAPAAGAVSNDLQKLAKIVWDDPPPEVELVNSARLAEIAAEIESRHRRDRMALWRLLGCAAAAVMAVILLVEAWQYFANDQPSAERLAASADVTAAEVMKTFVAAGTPLVVEKVETELTAAPNSRRADYDVVVTLRLQDNLYGPAESNGAQAYLQLQRSLHEAGDQMRKARLYLAYPELGEPVEMPLLLAQTHRVGEQLVVRVPLATQRVGWRWQLDASVDRMRTSAANFAGRPLGDYRDQSVLVFGTTEAREQMRPLMQEARRFILAVKDASSGRRTVAAPDTAPGQ